MKVILEHSQKVLEIATDNIYEHIKIPVAGIQIELAALASQTDNIILEQPRLKSLVIVFQEPVDFEIKQ